MCSRPARRRRRQSQPITPSLHMGRQTAGRRKVGGRVTCKFAFVGVGNSLADGAQCSKGKRATKHQSMDF